MRRGSAARQAAAAVWLARSPRHHRRRPLSRPTAPTREWAWSSSRIQRLMMLDEPASGLSRGERERLGELFCDLDADTTLLLIEHDMDVALRDRRAGRRDGRRSRSSPKARPTRSGHDPLVQRGLPAGMGRHSCLSSLLHRRQPVAPDTGPRKCSRTVSVLGWASRPVGDHRPQRDGQVDAVRHDSSGSSPRRRGP